MHSNEDDNNIDDRDIDDRDIDDRDINGCNIDDNGLSNVLDSQQDSSVEIPFEQLSAETLQAVIEDYVTREGTDYGAEEYSLDQKVAQIHTQLIKQNAVIVFDTQTESCTLLLRNG